MSDTQTITALKFYEPYALFDPNSTRLIDAAIAEFDTLCETEPKLRDFSCEDDFWGDKPENSWVRRYRPYNVVDGTLTIPVKGGLMHKFSYTVFDWLTGYDYIWQAFDRGMQDSNVERIVLDIDSGGGMVNGCFELAARLSNYPDRKPVLASVDASSYSAAYAIACCADHIAVVRTGGVGSIGVVTTHTDYSKALEMNGIKVTFIYSGDHKVDGNRYNALPEDVRKRIQAELDDIYGLFINLVAENREMTAEEVRATQALCFSAPNALTKGLIDSIGSQEETFTAWKGQTQTGDRHMSNVTATTLTHTQAQVDEAVSAAAEKQHAKSFAEGVSAERTRIQTILSADVSKNRQKSALAMALKSDMSAETALAVLAELPEEKADTVAAAPNHFATAMDNSANPPILANAPTAETDESTADAAAINQSFGKR